MQVTTKQKSYNVDILNCNSAEIVANITTKFDANNYIILTENGVLRKAGEEISSKIIAMGLNCHVIYLESIGEGNKSFENAGKILENILKNVKVTRNSVLIGLGGGTIGDLSGFIASIMMRGIKLVHIPTTFLAMVDSGIGGKTGINFAGYKNIVGTFYQPDLVICNVKFLETLPYNEYISGYVELAKHAIISEKYPNLLAELLENEVNIFNRNLDFLSQIIKISCAIKADIVMQDELEILGIRSFLNLGHTIAHAIEKIPPLDGKILHGFAVAMGIIAEMKLAKELGVTQDTSILQAITQHFANLKIPVKISEILPNYTEYLNVIAQKVTLDKKNSNTKHEDLKISFALTSERGKIQNIQVAQGKLQDLLPKILI